MKDKYGVRLPFAKITASIRLSMLASVPLVVACGIHSHSAVITCSLTVCRAQLH